VPAKQEAIVISVQTNKTKDMDKISIMAMCQEIQVKCIDYNVTIEHRAVRMRNGRVYHTIDIDFFKPLKKGGDMVCFVFTDFNDDVELNDELSRMKKFLASGELEEYKT
jgi:hypothetical protein